MRGRYFSNKNFLKISSMKQGLTMAAYFKIASLIDKNKLNKAEKKLRKLMIKAVLKTI